MRSAQPRPSCPVARPAGFPSLDGIPLTEKQFAEEWRRLLRNEGAQVIDKGQAPPMVDHWASMVDTTKAEIMRLVKAKRGITAGEISTRIKRSESYVQRILTLMCDDGLLSRKRDRVRSPYRYEVAQ